MKKRLIPIKSISPRACATHLRGADPRAGLQLVILKLHTLNAHLGKPGQPTNKSGTARYGMAEATCFSQDLSIGFYPAHPSIEPKGPKKVPIFCLNVCVDCCESAIGGLTWNLVLDHGQPPLCLTKGTVVSASIAA